MKFLASPFSLRSLTSGLAAFATLSVAIPAMSQSPANDLTITVNELSDGDVKFTASGTSLMLMSGSFYTTNADSTTITPPHLRPAIQPTYVYLPEGLIFTVPSLPPEGAEESAPEEIVMDSSELQLNSVSFDGSGFWHMGSFYSGYLEQGDPITGSGTVTVSKSEVPFSDFVPGTFKVRSSHWGSNEDLYDLTYKVIPYAIGLEVETPARFPDTLVLRSSAPQVIAITNVGSMPVSGLKVRITRAGKKNFRVSQPGTRSLGAGESTTFQATFRPGSAGSKSARITVTDGTSRKNITLRGKGVETRINSPRFPRAPQN